MGELAVWAFAPESFTTLSSVSVDSVVVIMNVCCSVLQLHLWLWLISSLAELAITILLFPVIILGTITTFCFSTRVLSTVLTCTLGSLILMRLCLRHRCCYCLVRALLLLGFQARFALRTVAVLVIRSLNIFCLDLCDNRTRLFLITGFDHHFGNCFLLGLRRRHCSYAWQ